MLERRVSGGMILEHMKCRTIYFVFLLATVAEGGAVHPVAWKDSPGEDAEYIPTEVDEGGLCVPEREPPVGVGDGCDDGLGVEIGNTSIALVAGKEQSVGEGGD